jgi:GTPase
VKSVDSKQKLDRKMIKSGLVALDYRREPKAVKTFDAKIIVYRTHHTTIKLSYEPILHVNSLRTATKLIQIMDKDRVYLRKSVDKSTVPKVEQSEPQAASAVGDSTGPAKQNIPGLEGRAGRRLRNKQNRKARAKAIAADMSDMSLLRLGDRATVRLTFKFVPGFVCVGDKVLLTESDVRMTGEIVNIVE